MDDSHQAERGTSRMLERMMFLSDAVFAIVLTLLVLDLRLPAGVTDATLFHGVGAMTPRLLAFALTFALVSIFWIAHVSLARRLTVFDWPVAWLNLGFLFTVCLTPFVSSVLGEFNASGNAWRLYCSVLIAIGAAQVAQAVAILRNHGRLVGGASRREIWHRVVRAASPGLAFVIVLALSLAGLTRLSVYLSFVLAPVILFIARRVLGDAPPAAAPAKLPAGNPRPTRRAKRR